MYLDHGLDRDISYVCCISPTICVYHLDDLDRDVDRDVLINSGLDRDILGDLDRDILGGLDRDLDLDRDGRS